MMFDLAKILKSKREYRVQLAARSIAEKLAMLDALRERELAIRQSGRPAAESSVLHEDPARYGTGEQGSKG
jgi:hypothetical protein